MDKELEEIKKKKMDKLKEQYLKRGKNMIKNSPKTVLTVTDSDLEEVINKYETIVVDCWAPWCGPCRMIAPTIEELAKEMQGKIIFVKLNVDDNPVISAKHQIMSIPTLLVFKNGNLVDRLIGAYPKDELKKRLKPYQ